MFTVRKKFRFEAAHRLSSSYSKACQQIHGHSYIVEMLFSSMALNEDGMVIDFGRVKDVVGPLIEAWDHKLIFHDDEEGHKHESAYTDATYTENAIMIPFNPTAENMAKYLYRQVRTSIPEICLVKVHETETGWASYSDDNRPDGWHRRSHA